MAKMTKEELALKKLEAKVDNLVGLSRDLKEEGRTFLTVSGRATTRTLLNLDKKAQERFKEAKERFGE